MKTKSTLLSVLVLTLVFLYPLSARSEDWRLEKLAANSVGVLTVNAPAGHSVRIRVVKKGKTGALFTINTLVGSAGAQLDQREAPNAEGIFTYKLAKNVERLYVELGGGTSTIDARSCTKEEGFFRVTCNEGWVYDVKLVPPDFDAK